MLPLSAYEKMLDDAKESFDFLKSTHFDNPLIKDVYLAIEQKLDVVKKHHDDFSFMIEFMENMIEHNITITSTYFKTDVDHSLIKNQMIYVNGIAFKVNFVVHDNKVMFSAKLVFDIDTNDVDFVYFKDVKSRVRPLCIFSKRYIHELKEHIERETGCEITSEPFNQYKHIFK